MQWSDASLIVYRYKRATVCFAYLKDTSNEASLDDTDDWFTRGWTLQELIAPKKMYFYNKEWQRIGNKDSLRTTLSKITGIDERVLSGVRGLGKCSIAQRMSWASKRQTKRIEDIAYCLLGIFDVNMPLLYGEREKAFMRLQEEIIRQSPDESIFAWQDERIGFVQYQADVLADPIWQNLGSCNSAAAEYVQEETIRTAKTNYDVSWLCDHISSTMPRLEQSQTLSSMLAKSPKGFRHAGAIVGTPTPIPDLAIHGYRYAPTKPFTLTNRGLKTKRHLLPWSLFTYLLPLECSHEQGEFGLGILLRRLRGQNTQYARVQVFGEQLIHDKRLNRASINYSAERDIVYVPRPLPHPRHFTEYVYGFHIDIEGLKQIPHDRVMSRGGWNEKSSIVFLKPGDHNPNDVCEINLDGLDKPIKRVKLGFDYNFVPFFIASKGKIENKFSSMNDKDRSIHNSKEIGEKAKDRFFRHFLPVEGQPGLWIRSHETQSFPRLYYLLKTDNVKSIVAKVSLSLAEMSSDYRTQLWVMWTVKLEFSDLVSSNSFSIR